ncbi:MAG TPA: hypothetical protein V6C52_13470 [Coleofasciculaceae cyanobacterium]|jgi:hypothetical protein
MTMVGASSGGLAQLHGLGKSGAAGRGTLPEITAGAAGKSSGVGSAGMPKGASGGAGPSADPPAGDQNDEYKSPVTAMLKQVHEQLGKSGKGLPGFTRLQSEA